MKRPKLPFYFLIWYYDETMYHVADTTFSTLEEAKQRGMSFTSEQRKTLCVWSSNGRSYPLEDK